MNHKTWKNLGPRFCTRIETKIIPDLQIWKNCLAIRVYNMSHKTDIFCVFIRPEQWDLKKCCQPIKFFFNIYLLVSQEIFK